MTVSVDVKPTHYSLSAGAPCPNLFFFHGSKMRGKKWTKRAEETALEIVDADALSTIGTRTRGDSMLSQDDPEDLSC